MTSVRCVGIDHIQIGVGDIKISGLFYDRLLKYFGFKVLSIGKHYRNWHNSGRNTFSIEQVEKKHVLTGFHRKRVGLNHIAFRAARKSEVDNFYKKYLLANKIPVLYGGPKKYPEYYKDYYAVYFEDPDRIKLEFMCFGKQ
ncbi:MAG: VOC family protein [Patescibacteria group bacterium]|jgi:catechol 2,3-dioxygenase-like lactoylglutathione lyase family enzyme